MRFGLFFIVILPFFFTTSRANEFVRPEGFKDYSNLEQTTVEKSIEVKGSVVAWADYDVIKRDFPALKKLSNSQIDEWLIQNFSYIGISQSELNGIRNSKIPVGSKRKLAFRPKNWNRAAVLEATDFNGSVIGMVDIKGFGHGAQTFDVSQGQVEKFNQIKNSIDDLEKLRTLDHSDGLMSLGEAIAEVSRQKAAQKLFEMSGKNLETVESYAIIVPRIDILKNKNQSIPSALYLRQAHQGRSFDLNVPSEIYIDEHGNKQMTSTGTAVDFGGVQITDENLSKNFGLFDNSGAFDPQKSKPWVWGHDVALAWKKGDKKAIQRHLNEMLAPIQKKYETSIEVKSYKLKSAEKIKYLSSLQGKPFKERIESLKNWSSSDLLNIKNSLQHPDLDIRKTAANLLMGKVEKEYSPLFEIALQDKDPDVRRIASHALIGRSDKESIPLIKIALNDKESDVRRFGLKALAARKDRETIFLIEAALNHTDPYVQRGAAEALLGRTDKELIPLIENSMKSTDWYIRKIAVRSLTGRTDTESIPLLEKALKDTNSEIRLEATKALIDRTDEESTSLLKKAIQDSEASVRRIAIEILAKRKDKQSISILEKEFQNPDVTIRNEVVNALAGRNDKESLLLLEKELQDPDSTVKRSAAYILGTRTDKESIPLLKAALQDPDLSVRENAASALANRTEKELIPLFKLAFEDTNSSVRKIAFGSLIGKTDKGFVPFFEMALDHPDFYIRMNATKALSGRADKESVPLLLKSLQDSDTVIRRFAANALTGRKDEASIELFEKALQDSDVKVRTNAIRALADRTDEASLVLFEKALQDPDPEVRKYAAQSQYRALTKPNACKNELRRVLNALLRP